MPLYNIFYKKNNFVLRIVLIASLILKVQCGLSDYLTYFAFTNSDSTEIEASEVKVPYEVNAADEKFIAQAIYLTGVESSALDACQHRLVLKLKSDCQRLNDEMISKMAVGLLNCQSYIEGRPLYPCTETMSIKDCTSGMDPDAWNSYLLMSNRARAVCYNIRQVQFRGLTELTVNNLMQAAKNQLNTLDEIHINQNLLKDIAEDTLRNMNHGQQELLQQQDDLKRAQFYGQLLLEDNIQKLGTEKKLISESNAIFSQMTLDLQKQIEEASLQIENQANQSDEKHKELITDLNAIKDKATTIFKKIADSSNLLIQQAELAERQYEDTLRKLSEVNKTITSLVALVGGTKQALEERMEWLSDTLGGTDVAIERLYLILWHILFILLAMIACAFINAPRITRITVITVIPANLGLSLYNVEYSIDTSLLGLTIIAISTVQMMLLLVTSYINKPEEVIEEKKIEAVRSSGDNLFYNSEYDFKEKDEEYYSPTPPPTRNEFLLGRRSPSITPSVGSSFKASCLANTRQGTPCKLSAAPGRDFCFRHQRGESIFK